MLTSEHVIVEYRDGRARPDRLERRRHAHYTGYAERMLAIYRTGIGRERRALRRDVETLFAEEPDCPVRRIRAFAKLLDDASTYQSDPKGEASRLRLRVFEAAAPRHPLVRQKDRLFEHTEAEVKAAIAADLGRQWDQIDARLYADVTAFQRLESFRGYPSAVALLSRYNVAQLQACLYAAERMTVRATRDFKTILRYAKLARLLHEVRGTGPSEYVMDFSGPASVLRETRRYGVSFARFLPALLACRGWRLTAVLFEIVGFWTPEYLAKKREMLRRFRGRNILLAVPERSLRKGAQAADNVIVYRTSIKLDPVLEALETVRICQGRRG